MLGEVALFDIGTSTASRSFTKGADQKARQKAINLGASVGLPRASMVPEGPLVYDISIPARLATSTSLGSNCNTPGLVNVTMDVTVRAAAALPGSSAAIKTSVLFVNLGPDVLWSGNSGGSGRDC